MLIKTTVWKQTFYTIAGLICAFVLLFGAPVVFAQFDMAAVLGTIRDASGAVVPSATVTLQNLDTGISANYISDAKGDFEFLNVKIGTYRLKAEAGGFSTATSENFRVTVSARQRVDLALRVGEVSETVVVSDAASRLETETSERGQIIEKQQVVDLPLNGRSYADLTLLAPGVRRGLRDDREGSYNVNGMRFQLNNFQLDGVDNNAYATSNVLNSNQALQISPDAVEEFRVQTNSYSAEYGRTAGAIINASIRSGTNRFNLSMWEFDRNTALNATGFFRPVDNVKPVLRRNQFGFAAGGPIKHDMSFFFIDYEGLRHAGSTIMYSSVPTMDQRQGILGTSVVNPVTGKVYSNGIIPTADISSFAQKVLGQLPAPNLAGVANNYQSSPLYINHADKFDVKLDHHFNKALSAFVRVSQQKSNVTGNTPIPAPLYGGGLASGASVAGYDRTMSQGLAAAITYVLSPSTMVDVHFGMNRTKAGEDPFGLGSPGMKEVYGITGLPEGSTGGGLTPQSISGFTGMGRDSGLPHIQNPTVYDLPRVNFSKIKGRFTLKAGYEYLAYNTKVSDTGGLYGGDTYSGQFSKPAGGKANSSVYNLADFLFGNRSGYSLTNQFFPTMEQWMHFLYIQNDFKATSKLTLNLGLRYEFATPQMEKDNKLSNYDPTTHSILLAKDGSIYDRSLVHPDYNNFAPRVGFAYSFANRWVMRSGFGVSYVHFNRLGSEDLLPMNLPQTVTLSVTQQPSQALCTSSASYAGCFRPTQMGYPEGVLVAQNVDQRSVRFRYIAADSRTPYVMNWHLSIQRELPGNLIFDIGYVGNRSLKLPVLSDYNQAVPNPPLPAAAIPLNNRRPIQEFGNIQIAWNRDDGSYHALQAKLERRFSGGFSLLNSFTFSKAIDLAPGQLEDVGVGTVVANQNTRINYLDPGSEKGLATTDVPFLNITSVIWEVPVGRGRKFGSSLARPLDYALGGWRLSLINSMSSGNPITFIYSAPSDYTVSSNSKDYRPNLVGNPILPADQRTPTMYWNKAALQIPTDRTHPFGNAGRNIARSDGVYTLDLGLMKEVPLPVREGTRLQIRAEAFNLLNKTNLQNADSNLSDAGFGQILSTYPARQLQLALKLYF